jgi:hypothetical protein
MSTQLRATRHTDALDMVVLPSTGASPYHNYCTEAAPVRSVLDAPSYMLNGPQCGYGCSAEEIRLPLPGIEPRSLHFVA